MIILRKALGADVTKIAGKQSGPRLSDIRFNIPDHLARGRGQDASIPGGFGSHLARTIGGSIEHNEMPPEDEDELSLTIIHTRDQRHEHASESLNNDVSDHDDHDTSAPQMLV